MLRKWRADSRDAPRIGHSSWYYCVNRLRSQRDMVNYPRVVRALRSGANIAASPAPDERFRPLRRRVGVEHAQDFGSEGRKSILFCHSR